MTQDTAEDDWRPPQARMDDLHRLARLGDEVEDAYKLEYSPSRRAACNGRQPCSGTKIGLGELRLGVWVDFGSEYGGSFKWRHYGCITARQIANMKIAYGGDATLIPGFDALDLEDQHMVRRAFEVGAVDDEDLSELAPGRSKKPAAKASRSSAKKRSAPAYEDDDSYDDDNHGEGGNGGHATSDAMKELTGTPGELDDVKEEIKPEMEPPKKRGRGRPKKAKVEEEGDVKPSVVEEGEAAIAPAEEEDTRAGKQEPKVEEEEEAVVTAEEQVEEDVKPKRSLRSRKPPASATDAQFVHGA
ncbi:hypothetical protein BCR35DRAFT_331912 [Leucosporidium creatinivorum]|uniref:PARP-type domain-containing protein n=1 Tax=Leucosporidium creatinivorum TaxID=106004 RepID=A0A1Y2F8R0_9BASI|nr:hypothetical protein BCR35DRAFT_331912 [Leucosporidium creatinivorum]